MTRSQRQLSIPPKVKVGLFVCCLVILFASLAGIVLYSTSSPVPIEGSSPTLYATQCRDDLCLNLKQVLKKAKKTILVIIFSLTDQEIIHTLQAKAEEGVQITVIYDASASRGLQQRLGNNIRTIKRQGLSGLMHRKIVVVDESLIWAGSANLTSSSLRRHDNLVMGLHAPNIAQVIHAKAERIIQHKPPQEAQSNSFLVDGQPIELWFVPEDRQALDRLIQLIRGAEKTIRIAMYTWTHPLITEEIINAHRRGITVEAALDRQMSHGANARAVHKLEAHGIPLGFNKGSQLLHHKFAWIDDSILVMGSANWTKAAFARNEDCLLILHQLTEKQRRFMSTLWDHVKSEGQIPSKFLRACGE